VCFSQEQGKDIQAHLNHAFIQPDVETYNAIRTSPAVKKFAVFEERTTHRKDKTYTGFYLYGEHTYFEFLKRDDKEPGWAIAFGVDETGGIETLRKRAEAAGMKSEVRDYTRQSNGKDVAWFSSLEPTDRNSPSIGIWTLEYKPTFLREWNPRPETKEGVRREDVLARYAAVVKQKPSTKLMADISTIYVDLPPEGLEPSIKDCKVLGWKALGGENSAFCTDGKTTLILRARKNTQGIAAIRFKLRREAEEAEYKLGDTVLKIQGKAALWNFRGNKETFPLGHEAEEEERERD
jgi:hypothetical protein